MAELPYLVTVLTRRNPSSSCGGGLEAHDEILQEPKRNLDHAQHRMKTAVDKHRRELQFQVGDMVMVKLHPL